jgi:SAM-dependent methyltransferase
MVEKATEIKAHVRKRYSEVALNADNAGFSCCEPTASPCCCGTTSGIDYAENIGYHKDELVDLPETVIGACAGCGNPSALAGLIDGEIVLDLGSGGGIDAFLAAKKVGPEGYVIGVDMTQEMIELSRKNADEIGLENVEFRFGDIEKLPVEDESVNVIISNCVINLAPNKDRVFQEAYRVLKKGGRMLVSDIVTHGALPEEIKNDLDAWSECIAGALDEEVYLDKIRNAGFKNVRVISKSPYMNVAYSSQIQAYK